MGNCIYKKKRAKIGSIKTTVGSEPRDYVVQPLESSVSQDGKYEKKEDRYYTRTCSQDSDAASYFSTMFKSVHNSNQSCDRINTRAVGQGSDAASDFSVMSERENKNNQSCDRTFTRTASQGSDAASGFSVMSERENKNNQSCDRTFTRTASQESYATSDSSMIPHVESRDSSWDMFSDAGSIMVPDTLCSPSPSCSSVSTLYTETGW